MSTVTGVSAAGAPPVARATPRRATTPSLLQQLREIARRGGSDDEALARTVRLTRELTGAAAAAYFTRDPSGRLVLLNTHCAPARLRHWQPLLAALARTATRACASGDSQTRRDDGGQPVHLIAVPVGVEGRPSEALAVAMPGSEQAAQPVLAAAAQTLQLLAAHIAQWRGQRDLVGQQRDGARPGRITRALVLAAREADPEVSSQALVDGLRAAMECRTVVLGWRARRQTGCRVLAISGRDQLDRQSELVRSLAEAMDEVVLHAELTSTARDGEVPNPDMTRGSRREPPTGTPAAGPAPGDDAAAGREPPVPVPAGPDERSRECPSRQPAPPRLTTPAWQHVRRHLPGVAHCEPLYDARGRAAGALVLLDDEGANAAEMERSAKGDAGLLGPAIDLLLASRPPRWRRALQAWTAGSPRARRTAIWGACLLAVLTLAIPVPYRIRCRCQLQPQSRRFVSAPYEGRLQAACVELGEIVTAGQTLARMDPREIEWELGTLTAERRRADRRRDVARAAHDTAAAELAALEGEQLASRIGLLQERLEHLELKSPLRGVVLHGNPAQVEGARMSRGQTILEVAPLDELTLELEVPDRDIGHVAVGHSVRFRLKAQAPSRGTVARLHPRSEQRNAGNVFLAEVQVPNAHLQLRPGMQGYAHVAAGRHPLAWILFHKAWEDVLLWSGW
jgi:biotin carboxyl carrier protein